MTWVHVTLDSICMSRDLALYCNVCIHQSEACSGQLWGTLTKGGVKSNQYHKTCSLMLYWTGLVDQGDLIAMGTVTYRVELY